LSARSASRQDPGEFQAVELLLDLNKVGVKEPRDLAGIALVPGADEDEDSLSALRPDYGLQHVGLLGGLG